VRFLLIGYILTSSIPITQLCAQNSILVNYGCLAGFKKDIFSKSYFSSYIAERKSRSEAFVERSYYTNEDVANLFITLGLENFKFSKIRINVEIKKGEEIFLNKTIISRWEEEIKIPIEIKNLPVGEYSVEIKLFSINGEEIKKWSKILIKKSSFKEKEVKIDYYHKGILVENKLFFPFAPLWECIPREEDIKYIGESGFKTIHIAFSYKRDTVSDIKKCLELCKRYNLKVIFWIVGRGKEHDEAMIKWMEIFKEFPNIIAWYVVDEPFGEKLIKWTWDCWKIGKKIDFYRPVYINQTPGGFFEKYADLPGDILSIDTYNLKILGEAAKMLTSLDRRPGWMIIGIGGGAYVSSRQVTPEEIEGGVYLAIVNGVRGLSIWAGFPLKKNVFEKLIQLNKEIEYLTPIIFAQNKVFQVRNNYFSVFSITKKYNKKIYIISVNSTDEEKKVLFDLTPLKLSNPIIKVLFENREIKVDRYVFKDIFKPFQRHIYEIFEK